MKQNSSRRLFLQKTALTAAGLALFSSTEPLKAFESTNIPFDGYNPFAEQKTDLRTGFFSKPIEISGKIYTEDGTSIIPNAVVEVWHLSPNSTKYRHRAKLKTNPNGEYGFVTEMPNREEGKLARIYFKVSSLKKEYFTELLVTEFGAHITGKHWEENTLSESKLLPQAIISKNKSTIRFNITN